MIRYTAMILCDGAHCTQQVAFAHRDLAQIAKSLKEMGWIPGSLFHSEHKKRQKHFCCQECYESHEH